MSRFSLVCLALAASLFSGCSDSDGWKARTNPATGTLSINGEIPVNAIVQLMPVDQPVDSSGTRPFGRVRDDGTFALTTYEPGDGAPLGEYHLLVAWPQPGNPRQDRLKGAFGSPETSSLRVTIEKGRNQIPPIELANVQVLPPDASTEKPSAKSFNEIRDERMKKKKK